MIAGLLLYMTDPKDPVDRRAVQASLDVRRTLQKKTRGTAKNPAAAVILAAAQRWSCKDHVWADGRIVEHPAGRAVYMMRGQTQAPKSLS